MACYVMNGGWSRMYYDPMEFGLLWFLAQWPVIFVFQVRKGQVVTRLVTGAPWFLSWTLERFCLHSSSLDPLSL